jgi:hypothetical protein
MEFGKKFVSHLALDTAKDTVEASSGVRKLA